MSTFPQVAFKVRYPAGDGLYRFEWVDIHTPGGAGHHPMEHPPLIGDLVILPTRRPGGEPPLEGGPVFRVIDRMWGHSEYGSAHWPYGANSPVAGPLLEIIVEPARGLYADQAPLPPEDEEG
jgi:hypothetical protein